MSGSLAIDELQRGVDGPSAAPQGRSLPQALEAEQALLGAVLVNNDAWRIVSGLVEKDDFSEPLHAVMWEVVDGLCRQGIAATPVTVIPYLGSADLGSMTAPHYLARLAAEATTIVNAPDYARIIRNLAARRRMIAVANTLIVDAFNAGVNETPQTIIDRAQEALEETWQTIKRCDRLHIQIVTKRISAVEKRLATIGVTTWPQHAGLMITVCNQAEANRDIPLLLELKTRLGIPWVGLSIEPLLGPVDLNNVDINGDYEMDALNPLSWRELWDIHWSPEATGTPLEEAIEAYVEEGGVYPPTDERSARLDWVIVGGESGSKARPMHPDWARSLRDQCATADVPFFFKQWGEWTARDEWPRGLAKASSSIAIDARGNEVPDDIVPRDIGGQIFEKTGKACAGRRLDGFEHNAMPGALR